MNIKKVQQLINQEITEHRNLIGGKMAREQYAVTYWQIGRLTDLGILHLMPAIFGHSDADAVIKNATRGTNAAMRRAVEGQAIPTHPLCLAINEVEETEADLKAHIG